jgi:hypothetical protein
MAKQPEVTIKGLTFLPVPEFTDLDAAFGARRDKFFDRHDLPEVPRKYEQEASRLFYSGGEWPKFGADVDEGKARKAIRAWLCSFDPAHEAKTATVGYALWVWSPEAAKERAKVSA